ncbi:MAG TPA: CYTH and CHAD domain-containing protein, partial [Negativicutes bacterium]
MKHTETELKLQVTDPAIWDNIMVVPLLQQMAEPNSLKKQLLEARYFDTAQHNLQQAALTYRVRREGEQWVATVKGGGSSNGGLHRRQEWNVVVAGPEPDSDVFRDTAVGAKLQELIGEEELEPLFITRFTRYTLQIRTPDGSQVEVAADRGEIIVGTLSAPILELELELKDGQPTALLTLGAQLAREFPLLLETRSKFYRGLQLAGLAGEPADAAAVRYHIAGNIVAKEAVSGLLIESIHTLLAAQDRFLQQPAEPDNLHQLRVMLRRLRSLLSFVRPLIAAQQYSRYQEALRQWGQTMGPLRELDVLIAECYVIAANQKTASKGRLTVANSLTVQRQEALQLLITSLGAGQSTALLLEIWAWLAENPMQAVPQADLTLRAFSRQRLGGWLKNLLKQGKQLDITQEQELHQLRIRGKKLRYG